MQSYYEHKALARKLVLRTNLGYSILGLLAITDTIFFQNQLIYIKIKLRAINSLQIHLERCNITPYTNYNKQQPTYPYYFNLVNYKILLILTYCYKRLITILFPLNFYQDQPLLVACLVGARLASRVAVVAYQTVLTQSLNFFKLCVNAFPLTILSKRALNSQSLVACLAITLCKLLTSSGLYYITSWCCVSNR